MSTIAVETSATEECDCIIAELISLIGSETLQTFPQGVTMNCGVFYTFCKSLADIVLDDDWVLNNLCKETIF